MFKSPVPASPEAEKQNSSGAAWPMVLLAAGLFALLAWWFLRKK
jgi:hypothetical protein